MFQRSSMLSRSTRSAPAAGVAPESTKQHKTNNKEKVFKNAKNGERETPGEAEMLHRHLGQKSDAKTTITGSSGSLAAAIAYCLVSVLLTLFNQSVFGNGPFGFGLRATALISLLQQAVIGCGVLLMRSFGAVEHFSLLLNTSEDNYDNNGLFWIERAFRDPIWRSMAPLATSQMFATLSSFLAMQRMPLTMFTTLRRLTVVFVLVTQGLKNAATVASLTSGGSAGVVASNDKITRGIVTGVGLITAGAIIAGATDLTFDLLGYMAMFACNTATAFYTARIRDVREKYDLSLVAILLYNSLLTLPLLLVGAVVTGELTYLLYEFEYTYTISFWLTMMMSCMLAFALNYTVFWNVAANSPLTHEVTAQTKSFVTLIAGLVVFPQPVSLVNMFGVLVSLVGSSVYGAVKLKQARLPSPILVTTVGMGGEAALPTTASAAGTAAVGAGHSVAAVTTRDFGPVVRSGASSGFDQVPNAVRVV